MSQDLNGTLTAAATLSGNINTENTLRGSFGTSFGSADYNDLTNKPSINSVELSGNKTTSDLGIVIPTKTSDLNNDSGFITGSNLATVATTGNYNDLNHKPNLAAVATSGDYGDLVNKPDLAEVATTGSYLSLSNKPTIPAAQVNSNWNATSGVAEILNKPNLATVATSGDYDDLTNKPTIPPAQVNSDWNASTGVAEILNKPTLAAVATSGDYDDLTNKPTLATVATTGDYDDLTNKPTIPAAQVNSDWNAASGVAEILNKPTIPTKTSELTNDSNFVTSSDFSPTAGALTNMNAAFTGGTYSLTRTGKVCVLSFYRAITGSIGGTDELATLPSGFIPYANTRLFMGGTYNGTSGSYSVEVTTAGKVVASVGSGNLTTAMTITGTYICS